MKIAYTDGGCKDNPGIGGWAFIIEGHAECYGFKDDTTNNEMELTAMIELLKYIGRNEEVKIFSDSTYVIKGLTQWQYGWRKHNWTKSDGSPVANQDLWKELISHYNPDKHELEFVKGHSGNPGNERCDELVQLAKEERALYKMNSLKKEISSDEAINSFKDKLSDMISTWNSLSEYDKRVVANEVHSKLIIFDQSIKTWL